MKNLTNLYSGSWRIKRRHVVGAAIPEAAVALILFLFLSSSLIEFGRYLYLKNQYESAAHEALAVLAWAPGIDKEDDTREFGDGTEMVRVKAIENVESQYSGWQDVQPEIVELPSPDLADRTDSDSIKMFIGLPRVNGSRPEGLATNPMIVRLNAPYRPLIAFWFPRRFVIGEAMGYREPPLNNTAAGPRDCNGNPFNPRQIPTDCGCEPNEPLNPKTGNCGCTDPDVPIFVPATNTYTCGCNVFPLMESCPANTIIDPVRCMCGADCPTGQRISPDRCGCAEVSGTDGQCAPSSCTYANNVWSCVETNCTTANCPGGRVWAALSCACVCPSHSTVNPEGNCECKAPRVRQGDNCVCPPGSPARVGCPQGFIANSECECVCPNNSSVNENGVCQCERGYEVPTTNPGMYSPKCCSVQNCLALSPLGIPSFEAFGECGCQCSPPYRDIDPGPGLDCRIGTCGSEGCAS